jgi:carboxyl-terminal processing protease
MKRQHLSRRAFGAAGLGVFGSMAFAVEPPRDVTCLDDFDELWRTLSERYCFFDEKLTDWGKVRALYRPMAFAAETIEEFTNVVRQVLAELYDAHTHLSNSPNGSPRWPPYDMVVETDNGQVRIAAVEERSAAADAGLRIGDCILTIGGSPIDKVADALMPRCLSRPDPAAYQYAIGAAVAGRRGQGRQFTIKSAAGGDSRTITLPIKNRPDQPDVESRTLAGAVGYIAMRSFADVATIAAFDRALASLHDAPGLIIDVRGNGGGDTAVARPIMGRFISEKRPYALMRRRTGKGLSAPWTEHVEPRGPFTYTRPVVVLANQWSGSMAEGFPMGMRDIGRGRIVGTRMMGLGAAVFPICLDRTGIQAQYSAEAVYDTNDVPRWKLSPDVPVPASSDILAAGANELGRMIEHARSGEGR